MNNDIFEGKWHEFKGKVKQKWGKLTDNDLTTIEGNSERLSGLLQQKYGYTKEKAEHEIENFIDQDKK
jgi:uncharacterized protein YjbJ (UPF0337 family)